MYWIEAVLMQSSLALVPVLDVGYSFGRFSIKQVSSAECSPSSLTRWSPKTATWIVEASVRHENLDLFVGHKSYHRIGKFDDLKSSDYIGLRFRKEFK
jgi:hypothetical protein